MDRVKKVIPFIIILIISLLAALPVWRNGFFPMHDDTQPTRIFEMHAALKDGQFPVRWVKDLGYGYGYPIFNFYGPLPYYLGAGFMFLGVDALVATKLVITFGMILAGLAFYLMAFGSWGKLAAAIGAVFYLLAPYHAVQLYVRGALGEFLAYAFLPLAFALFSGSPSRWKLVISTFGFAAVLLSHTISGFILVWFIVIYFLVKLAWYLLQKKNIDSFTKLQFVSVFLALGLSAFFWLPAFTEAQLTRVNKLSQGTNDFHNHFVYLDQLWDSAWGFAGSSTGRFDGMSFKIGKLHIIGVMAALVLLVWKRKQRLKVNLTQAILLFSGFILSIVMMLEISRWLWELMPYFEFIQYPWRFLMFACFFGSYIFLILWKQLNLLIRYTTVRYLIGFTVIMAAVIGYGKYFEPQYTNSKTAIDYTDPGKIAWDISKISDEYLPKDFPIPKTRDEVASQDFRESSAIIVKTQDVRSHRLHLSFSAQRAAEIFFSRAIFPEWRIILDGVKVEPEIENGKIQVGIPAGEHNLTVYLADTPVRLIGNYLSLISALVLLGFVIKTRQSR
ncbi:TPA: hypothetical protein DIV55_00250 [Patescibacteria group bacterium]|uniref:Membrane protein 6-pyruvoyl-tetrahydropterin synthase-related domain-containing protein n=1 Tax=Candidatus Gottesmanbacteria bacterium GW2011_GWA1_43_11 TaxID=1618436 RepID=A0A0G1CJ79_9BACT|nr:MAG: hypothetical protein UV59_C0004G0028 [Candidatus Gottesmanbacteria bacterium GW2011_GWA1_43_11]HCS78157.1 hypothetical protein [Patescibacteria group bacterium]